MGIRRKRQLRKNAVPIKFTFSSQKKRRESSIKRAGVTAKRKCVEDAITQHDESVHEPTTSETFDDCLPFMEEKCVGTEIKMIDKCLGNNIIQKSIRTQCDPFYTNWGLDKNKAERQPAQG